jgi:hypothetical protein
VASDYDRIRRDNEIEYGRGARLLEFAKKNFPRRAHFLLELLQNAEDVGAKTINFALGRGGIEVRHDGRHFNEPEVRGVCGVGESTKTGDLTQIGTFGVGFKSVELYTCSPEVHCGDEHFVIERGFFPRAAQRREPGDSFTTLFVLPFDNLEMPANRAFREIADRLDSLSARTLLFLQSVHRLEWVIDDGTSSRTISRRLCATEGPSRVVILEEPDGTAAAERWLVFQRAVAIPGRNKTVGVEAAFQLEKSQADPIWRIVRVTDSPLVVFFPTDKPTQLGFLIQGAYRTTLARDSIPEDDAWNRTLVKETAVLVADTLPRLRDLGLLTVSVLETMPIDPSDFPEHGMFRPIFESVRETLREQPLLPTHDGAFVTAKNAKLAEENDLRELLSSRELGDLFSADAKWISGEVTGELRGYLSNELDVEEFTWDKFVRRLDAAFIQQRTDEWVTKFYSLLNKRPHLWRSPRGSWDSGGPLRDKPFIRLEDGSHVAPFRNDDAPNVYLPPEGPTDYPIVKREIAADEAARLFLGSLKLKKPSAVTDVIENVLPKYAPDALAAGALTAAQHAGHIEKIIHALRSADQDEKSALEKRLKETPFLRAENVVIGETVFMRPEKGYIRSPELELYFAGNADAHFLARDYTQEQAEVFCQLGVSRTVRVRCKPADSPGYVAIEDYWGSHKRGLHHFDPSAEIDGLEHALTTANSELAAYVWSELLIPNRHLVRGTVESSSRQTFENARCEVKLSKLGQLVCESAWLPSQGGTFHKQAELSLDDLPGGFVRDESLASALGMKPAALEARARQAGMALVRLDEYEEFKSWQAQRSTPEFPQKESSNRELRSKRVTEEAKKARPKQYDQVTQSLRTSDDLQKDARTYLEHEYTDDYQRMFCQVCEKEMPFKLDNGKYYFEAVECVKDADREHRQNHLALCPTCAAKYRHANGSSSKLREAILHASGFKVPVILAREPQTIRFVEEHLQDMQAALQSESTPQG